LKKSVIKSEERMVKSKVFKTKLTTSSLNWDN